MSRSSPSSKSTTKPPRPSHHANDTGTLFKNPWPSANKPTWSELLGSQNPFSWYSSHDLQNHQRAKELKMRPPDWGSSILKTRGLERENCILGTWLGHAGVMVELPLVGARGSAALTSPPIPRRGEKRRSLWVLFDPIFSMRAGPSQYTGPSRIHNSPCQVSDLPACDVIAISHNHYDHMDLSTIRLLATRFPSCRYFVPLGNKAWLASVGIRKDLIFELDWWEQQDFSLSDLDVEKIDQPEGETKIRFSCVPAQHNSGRGTLDQGSTLWCGWVLEQLVTSHLRESDGESVARKRKGAVYHAGDTGYRRTVTSTEVCPIFEEIGAKFGPLDLSFVPIWRGGTLGFVSSLGLRLSHQDVPATFHASPADGIAIHRLVKSRNTVGVHFGTFVGSHDESYEAIIEFDEARDQAGVGSIEETQENENGNTGTLDIGGTIAIQLG